MKLQINWENWRADKISLELQNVMLCSEKQILG